MNSLHFIEQQNNVERNLRAAAYLYVEHKILLFYFPFYA